MRKRESVSNRKYTEEFKTEAIRLALSTGGNAAAKRLGIPQSTMTNWVRQSREGASAPVAALPVKRPVSEVEAENARLRRELANERNSCQVGLGEKLPASQAREVLAAAVTALGLSMRAHSRRK